jgi:hypothetical protein
MTSHGAAIQDSGTDRGTGPLPFDTSVAHQARMYDYVLGSVRLPEAEARTRTDLAGIGGPTTACHCRRKDLSFLDNNDKR